MPKRQGYLIGAPIMGRIVQRFHAGRVLGLAYFAVRQKPQSEKSCQCLIFALHTVGLHSLRHDWRQQLWSNHGLTLLVRLL